MVFLAFPIFKTKIKEWLKFSPSSPCGWGYHVCQSHYQSKR